MLSAPAVRYAAIIIGTILWDVASVLQKQAVDRLPGPVVGPRALLTSPRWLAGLGVTTVGWAFYVFGLQQVGVSAARTITGGSYVVLALFSLLFLRARLSALEWGAVLVVTAGILLLGRTEPPTATAIPPGAATPLAIGCAAIALLCGALLLVRRAPLVVFATIAGLLSSVGDVMVKILTTLPTLPVFILCAALLIAFYATGFYMLSRSYKAGSMVASVVLSDFSARVGAVFLGGMALGEAVTGPGLDALLRSAGFLLVLGGSVLLGRFGATGGERPA